MLTLFYRNGFKRFIDVSCSIIAIVLFSPILIVIALAVYVRMGNPIIFKQSRPGYKGQLFSIYKFRTLTNAKDSNDKLLPDSQRITRFGQWLRSTSLDELPELINVLKGDMSLVGPRPLLERYLSRYSADQQKRHDVLPGITGLAQINGRNAISWNQKFAYDLQYIERYSLLLDLKIIYRTLYQVLKKKDITSNNCVTAEEFLGTVEPMPSLEETSLQFFKHRSIKWPVYTDEEIEAVAGVLKSGNVNVWTGVECKKFQEEFAQSIGVKHAIAVANGTVALELALLAIGIKPGDEVVVPCRTFIATASAVVARGGIPVCADIDPYSQNVTCNSIAAAITDRTKGIIVVHVGGWPCEMNKIIHLAREKKLFVIEDCAQAHGAAINGQPVGSFGDVAAYSFCQDKIISTGGEGGLIATNYSSIWEKAWAYKDHGKSRRKLVGGNASGIFQYVHDEFGTNMRMTEMQAAIGRIQLRKLSETVAIRRRNAEILCSQLQEAMALRIPRPSPLYTHAFYKLYGSIDEAFLKPDWSRDRIVSVLREYSVPIGTGSCGEIYLEKAFERFGSQPACANGHEAQNRSLCFLVDPTFDENDMLRYANIIKKVLKHASIDWQDSTRKVA